jgi:hypothetical protein
MSRLNSAELGLLTPQVRWTNQQEHSIHRTGKYDAGRTSPWLSVCHITSLPVRAGACSRYILSTFKVGPDKKREHCLYGTPTQCVRQTPDLLPFRSPALSRFLPRRAFPRSPSVDSEQTPGSPRTIQEKYNVWELVYFRCSHKP